MKITVLQPPYFCGDTPDEAIAEFLYREMEKAEENSLTVLPEYSNAGELSEKEASFVPCPVQRKCCKR